MLKISSENWFSNYTFPDRYYLTGIDKIAIEYVKKLQAKKITIVDVGCSTAVALKRLQNTLKDIGVDSYTIGIDIDEKVKKIADDNTNLFINKDVIQINNLQNVADIVICSKMALWIPAIRRYEIIMKCGEFLNKAGILITDVDYYQKTKLREELKELGKEMIPPFLALKNGARYFIEEYKYKLHGHFRKRMQNYDKESTVKYAQKILEEWNKLRWDQKLSRKFDILNYNILYKLIPSKPKN